jgi:hypothetical protein
MGMPANMYGIDCDQAADQAPVGGVRRSPEQSPCAAMKRPLAVSHVGRDDRQCSR